MLSVPILPPPGSRLRSAPLPLGLATLRSRAWCFSGLPHLWAGASSVGLEIPMASRPPMRFGAATDQFWGGGLFFFRHAAADQHTGQ